MTTFKYQMQIQATEEKEAESKMRSLSVLASKLSAAELAKLSDIVANDPVKTAMAKKALGIR